MKSQFSSLVFVVVAGAAVASSFYTTYLDDNDVWWLRAPDGTPTLSLGVTSLNIMGDYCPATKSFPYYNAVMKKYNNDQNAWIAATSGRLHSWGFNTDAGWTYLPNVTFPTWPYTPIVDFGLLDPDWTSDAFTQQADTLARYNCGPLANDPNLIGYFTTNELYWGAAIDRWPFTFRENVTKLIQYLEFDVGSSGRTTALSFLQSRYHNSIDALNAAWKVNATSFETIVNSLPFNEPSAQRFADYDAFLSIVATKFFQVVHQSIRKYDPNHLILGCRYSYFELPDVVIAAEAPYVDASSYNGYVWWPGQKITAIVSHIHAITNKPVVISEYGFRANNNTSGDPNWIGAGWPVATQQDRVDALKEYYGDLLGNAATIGLHWYKYADQPPLGRPNWEDSNFGLVDINDNVYKEVTQAFTALNSQATEIHAKSGTISPISSPS